MRLKGIKYLLVSLCLVHHSAFAQDGVERLSNLAFDGKAPIIYDSLDNKEGPTSLYFGGMPYKGKPTRIFAYYDTPQGKGPFPAIVLVQGGGGSAYKTWVKKWNDAGFAAISIAVEGQTGTLTGKRPPNKWVKHEWGGPRRPGIYNDADNPLTDQWMYHATSATILAHNLLRSFKEIKKDQIGVSGISWGGVITSTVIGFDQRFAFAIPIYGSGYLDTMDNHYGKALIDNATYREIWEPALRISKFKGPTFWLTGLKENNFSLDVQAKTYRAVGGIHQQSIQSNLKHSHPAGWTPKEPYAFAQAVISGQGLPVFHNQKILAGRVTIDVKFAKDISAATLYYTLDKGHTHKREWHQQVATVKGSGEEVSLNAKLPTDATAWLFNINDGGLIFSSDFSE